MNSTTVSNPMPLKGIKVLDLSRLLPGPMCSMHLADLGADVIKIEDTGQGDYARFLGAITTRINPLFHMVNRGKRSLSIDLREPDGLAAFYRLVEQADVVLETFRPGVAQKLKVDFETLKAHKADLIYCSISGYGQTGPWKDKPGHDINYCSITGALEQTGEQTGPPVIGNWQIADLAGGALSGFAAISTALVQKATQGIGSYIDLSMTDAVFAHSVASMAAVKSFGRSAPRGGDMLTGAMPGYDIYKTKDNRFLAVGALEQKFWQTLCTAIDRMDLIAGNIPNNTAAKDLLTDAFLQKTMDEWLTLLGDIDCCVTPVLSPKEALEHPQLISRNMISTTHTHLDGEVIQPASPFRFDGQNKSEFSEGPMHGEHSESILQEFAFEAHEIQQLLNDQVIKQFSDELNKD